MSDAAKQAHGHGGEEIAVFTLMHDGRFCESVPLAGERAADEYALKRLAEALGVELTGDAEVDWKAVREVYDAEECAYEYQITTSPVFASADEYIAGRWSDMERARIAVGAADGD